MRYVCFKQYTGITADNKRVSIPVGAAFATIGDFITSNNAAVCAINSCDGLTHFARDDDGNGALRGSLTSSILSQPLTDEQLAYIREQFPTFLDEDNRFTPDFYVADIDQLQLISAALKGVDDNAT